MALPPDVGSQQRNPDPAVTPNASWMDIDTTIAWLFEDVPALKLEQVKSRAATAVTHLTYRVLS